MRLRLAVFVAVMGILAISCGGGTPAATTAPTVAASQAATASAAPKDSPMACCKKVIAAYSNVSADDWVMWYAFEKGIFKERGLDVDMQSINGGAQTSAALLANQIGIGQFGGAEALSAVAGGADLVIVANMAPVYPYVLYAQKTIKTVADLKGKKVGVSNKGGSSDIATRAALKANGLDPDKDVSIVAVGSHANRTAALLTGSIDAGVDDPPEDQELIKNGLVPIYDLNKLPAANTGVIVQRSFLTANKDIVQAYIDATVIARSRMAKDKDGATAVLLKYFKNDPASNDHAYNFFIAGTNPVTPVYPAPAAEQMKDAVTILGADNDKIKTVDLSKLLDASLVKNAQDRKLGG
ncbi:MAG TPA: ABC transporter substrate-binding protein [Candidatus Acidoferrales bacterium]|nr:ABC transporter substrate-binding protein [Candidatus Acidoferrales bacterium]